MKEKSQDVKYYLSAVSNFLAAIGGGVILGKGVNIIDNSLLHGGSVLAFFIGTVFGLLFLQIIPKKISGSVARSFAILAGIISLVLLGIFNTYSFEGKLTDTAAFVFFALLCIRFGFWFYSRVLRAAAVAGQQQKIAWVELGYYSGMIGGLIAWSILGIELGIATALIIDSCLQFIAGLIDLSINKNSVMTNKSSESLKTEVVSKYNKIWYWRLAASVAFLTIGTQVIIFSLAHEVSDFFTSYILAFYYLGVSIAAYFCRIFNIQMSWNRYASISIHSTKNTKKISITWNGIFNAIFVGLSIIGVSYWQWGISMTEIGIGEILLLTFVTIAAFFYEVFALALLDRIGLEERLSNSQGMIMRTYGLMGVSAAVSLWIIGITHDTMPVLLLTLSVCIIIPILFTLKRAIPENTG